MLTLMSSCQERMDCTMSIWAWVERGARDVGIAMVIDRKGERRNKEVIALHNMSELGRIW